MSNMRDNVCERCIFASGTHAEWCPILKDQEMFRLAVERAAKCDPILSGLCR